MKTRIISLYILSINTTLFASVAIFHSNGLIRLDNFTLNGVNYSNMPPPGVTHKDWQDNGHIVVIACGYDNMGIWRTVPLHIKYHYNGFQYVAIVLDAWNTNTETWDNNINIPAVNTYFTHCNEEYDFYVVLSTGTFYFNL